MLKELFRDPRARRAYLLTKVAVLSVAAAATWPLARVLGNRAWYGFFAFAALLTVVTAFVLAATSGAAEDRSGEDPAEDDDEEAEPPDPDPVVLAIEDSIDLHSFPPRDVPDVVHDYLEAAVAEGLSEVRLIHGRGIGVQRERVRSLLSRHPMVEEYSDATPDRGGWGATVVRLNVDARPSQKVPGSED